MSAADLYVATNAAPGSPYNTWQTGFTTVQAAVDHASDHDTIHLAGHVFASDAAISIAKPNLTLLGGYAATNTAGIPGEYDPGRWPTVLAIATGFTNRVVHINGITNVTLGRVTVTGGEANLGGGIFVDTATDIFLSDLVISNNVSSTNVNHAVARGGGLYALNSDLVVSNCHFIANRSLKGTTYANVSGAGVDLNGGTVTLVDSRISGNVLDSNVTADRSFGSGIRISSGTHLLLNLLFSHNAMNGNNGNAIYSRTANVEVHNATIVGHVGTAVNADANLSIYNSILRWNGTDADGIPNTNITSTCLQTPDLTGSQGNLNDDPRFERGLFLATNSPCTGAGDRSVAEAGLTGYTTQTNGAIYTGDVNLGYHHKTGLALPDLYVNPTGGNDGNTGLNATTEALQTITEALKRAQAGTRIHLAAGDYTNTVETFPLVITRHGIQIVGTNPMTTVIDAAGSDQRVMDLNQLVGSRIEGVTLTGGKHITGNATGGGLYIGSCQDLVIRHCRIADNELPESGPNHHYKSGGGIYALNTFATLEDSLIISNRVYAGGTLYGLSAPDANARGGGLFISGGGWTIRRSVIAGNVARSNFSSTQNGSHGGGMYIAAGGSHALINCLVARNDNLRSGVSAGTYLGDGIHTRAPLSLANVTIADNGASNPVEGQGIWMNAAVSIANSIVWGHDNDLLEDSVDLAAISHSSIGDGDQEGDDGNVSLDPSFMDTVYYHLKSRRGTYINEYFDGGTWAPADAYSLLVDAGDPDLPNTAWVLEPFPNGRRINIGAYGGTEVASISPITLGMIFTIQ